MLSDRLFERLSAKNVVAPAFGSETLMNRAYGQPLCPLKFTAAPMSYLNR